ncbi:hypothetical protein SLEP1_g49755 [Rubroshorea leprosula]|uniref:Uncharacterized protein n=1 Tax=Rubroshorea leprosula TaxID=152421 RepID=A0AAV5LYM2_9ROSI|nr:hypothetical protein SLEP1_g49755 [Rubroshorea leprosula]
MSRNTVVLVCLLIMALDITAGVLGIEAEKARNKTHWSASLAECGFRSVKAYRLGMAAAVFLGLAHVIANLCGGCICFWSKADLEKSSGYKKLAIASLIFSWITLAIGFIMLIMGALANSKSSHYCGISHHLLLQIGGILCFFHGFFSIAYKLSATLAT